MSLIPYALTVDRRSDPIGLGNDRPDFAWLLSGSEGQAAARIVVSTDVTFDDVVWDSGWVSHVDPFGSLYDGPPLAPRASYFWRVRVRTTSGGLSSWSEPARFEIGLLTQEDWEGRWITAPNTAKNNRDVLYFRREIELGSPVVRGRAYASGLGWYRLLVNTTDLTGAALVPRWTPFDSYVEYQTYDATDAFQPGVNVLGLVVADGRFRGRLGMSPKGAVYGDELAVIAQIDLDLADGTSVRIATDHTWTVGRGRVEQSDPKYGERSDHRVDDAAWLTPGGQVTNPAGAVELPAHPRELVAEEVERVTAIAELPGSVRRTPSGAQLIDFGQNFAGVARLHLPAGPGTRVRILYSEVLTPAGELDTGYLSIGRGSSDRWFQRDEVVLGEVPVDYTASFTIHGFRYVAVEGLGVDLTAADVAGVVLSSDLRQIGTFTASDGRLERLWKNVLWGLRSNFVDTPTDCPTRERSGWTGDIQVFGPTAVQIVDADNFLRRYLRNVATEQYADGRVPPIIPTEDSAGRNRNKVRFASTSVGWGDVTVMLPWTLYNYYGDVRVLRSQYASARAWVDQMARRAEHKTSLARRLRAGAGPLEPYVLDTGYHWGEWLRPGEGFSAVLGNLLTHRPVVASAYFAHSCSLLARTAEVIEERDDARRYDLLARKAAAAWRSAFVRGDGARIGEDKQDDYVRALAFDLLLPHQRPQAAHRLVQLIEAADHHLGTGFLSTPMLLETLMATGHRDVAFRLLFQETAPSWLSQVQQGATTIWESWEGYKSDGSAKGSHNHYAFGSVARFLQEHIGGLAPAEPGYRRQRIAPAVDCGLASAGASLVTPYGLAQTRWTREANSVELEVIVPPGTVAEVQVGRHREELPGGFHALHIDVT
ncbi:MAG: family 78 glycoside hydrolase catalytic domain [Cellulomonadaceae bacterium]|nr:family 78 glycoside hydrolase catalytic domain [Cellulomonadaceae bacterium]